VWYSFGWESQLLETGFLAIFLVPSSFFSLHQLPPDLPAPWVCVWGYRWLIVRIMLGAGLIKVRWKELEGFCHPGPLFRHVRTNKYQEFYKEKVIFFIKYYDHIRLDGTCYFIV